MIASKHIRNWLGSSKGSKKWLIGFSCFILPITAFLFYTQLYWVKTDIPIHNYYLIEMVEGDLMLRPHFLYYAFLWIFSLGAKSPGMVDLASLMLLPSMLLAKFLLLVRYFQKRIFSVGDRAYAWGSLFFAMIMLLIFTPPPDLTMNFKVGQIPPNIWHNSTGIFLTPFAILLFERASAFIRATRPCFYRHLLPLFLLSLLHPVIKPTFYIPFLAAFPLFLFIREGLRRKFWIGAGTLIGGMIVMLFQYAYFYASSSGSGRGIGISPFEAWSYWSDNILLSLLVSIMFPLAYALLHYRKVVRDPEKGLAALLFIFGLMVYIFLVEEGNVKAQNFNKSAVQANIILHMVFLGNFGKHLMKGSWTWKEKLLSAILGVLLFAGIVYMIKIPFIGIH